MSSLPINLEFDNAFFEAEWKCDHYVTPTMKKIWAVELDLLSQFINFCKDHGITYYVSFGTLIGAMRHKGFIPWDDDIDVVIPRKDYERVQELAPNYFKDPYFYQTERTDPGFSRHFARLRNSRTTAIPSYELDCRLRLNQGIWIDIFPMDNIPVDRNEREKWTRELNTLHRKMWSFSRWTIGYRMPSKNENLIKKMRFITGPVIKSIIEKSRIKNPYYEKYERLSKKYVEEDTDLIGVPWFTGFKERVYWSRSWFNGIERAAFENLTVAVPKEYDALLTHTYNDWHKFVKGSAVHYNTLFDPENSYLIYKENPDQLRKKIAEHNE